MYTLITTFSRDNLCYDCGSKLATQYLPQYLDRDEPIPEYYNVPCTNASCHRFTTCVRVPVKVNVNTQIDKLIYIAVPYSEGNASLELREYRYNAVTKYAAFLTEEGYQVFSPITQSHPISLLMDKPVTWEYYEKYDTRMLSFCTELHVLMLDGWNNSVGVKKEIELARKFGYNIHYIEGVKNA